MTGQTQDPPTVRSRHARPRPVDVARLGLGVAFLTWPRAFLRAAGSTDATLPRRAIRLLGARNVAQCVAGLVVRDRRVLLGDTAIEVTHALTTVFFAASSPRYRALALTSGAVAVGFAATDLRAFAAADPTRSTS